MTALQVFTLELFVFVTTFANAKSPLSMRIAGVYCPVEIRGDGTIYVGNAALNNWDVTSYGSFDGYIKGVRFRNEVMNTGNFTPPNAPFTY